jgi:hypothetical protein
MDLTNLPPGETEFVANFSFPKTLPAVDTPWRGIDFRTEPERYLRTLLAYGLKDNVDIDWRIEKGSQSWCHAPWFHHLRERIHGMTKERGSRLFELSEHQRSRAENWAIGFYNAVGCYALDVSFQQVVHSARAGKAEVVEASAIPRGPNEHPQECPVDAVASRGDGPRCC